MTVQDQQETDNIFLKNYWADLSSLWLLPGLILFTVLGNQPDEAVQMVGQIIGWINMLAAVLILFNTVRNKLWIVIVIILIVISKGLRVLTTFDFAEIAYLIFLNFLFCFAGAVLAFKQQNLVYKQLMLICLLNLIFMIFQVTGVGAWAQFLTTHGEGNLAEPVDTLFEPEHLLEYQIVQGRPAGLSYSNIILSLILMYAIALHFSASQRKVWWATFILCAMTVLAMAKLVFFGFILVVLWLLAKGDPWQRKTIIAAVTIAAVLLLLYFVLFPGLAATNLSIYTITYSIYIRVNDIVGALAPESALRSILDIYLADTARFTWGEEGEFVSGYAQLIKKLPMFMPIAAVGIWSFVIGFRRFKKTYPSFATRVMLATLVIGIYPVAFPIWGVQLYWFMAGLMLLPIFYVLRFRFLMGPKLT